MKLKITPKRFVIAAVNAVVTAEIAVLTAVGSHTANTQSCNFTADKWKGESKESFSQVSCYFSGDSGFSTANIRSVRGQLMTALKNAAADTESGQKLFTDAYSAPVGKVKIKCDTARKTDAEVMAVGGDFFYFHDFGLVSGAYFSENDTMQDGAVIDRPLAFELYGSDDIAGKNIYIDGVKCYISGVVDTPKDKAGKRCYGKSMKAYVSYTTAQAMAQYGSSTEESSADTFRDIESYECVIPSPVENFAMNTAEKIFGTDYKGKVNLVNSSERFRPKKRIKAFKKLSDSVIRTDGIKLPFWENSSRIAEYKLSWLYTVRRYLFIIPVLTLLWLGWGLIKIYKKNKSRIIRSVLNALEKKKNNLHRREMTNENK